MKIRVVSTIHDGKMRRPGEIYDAKKDEAARLIRIGVAEAAHTRQSDDDKDGEGK